MVDGRPNSTAFRERFKKNWQGKLAMDTTPKRSVKVTVNGKPFLVEVDDLSASPMMVNVNGTAYVVDIETVAVEQAPADESVPALDATAPPEQVPEKASSAPASPAKVTGQEVKAPMPGHIIDIVVKPGEAVSTGQALCLLEAMKMKNTIRSPRDGVIASVDVTVGQPVTYGDVLVTFK